MLIKNVGLRMRIVPNYSRILQRVEMLQFNSQKEVANILFCCVCIIYIMPYVRFAAIL